MDSDFRDVLAELMRENARFLIVGAHALGVHGVPRATVDLDIWVEPSAENARRVWRGLAAFGAPLESLGITETDFTRLDTVTQFGLPPHRIDIMSDISGVTFADAWAEHVVDMFDDLRVPYIGRAAFVRNKRASGRKKDLGDLESLGEE